MSKNFYWFQVIMGTVAAVLAAVGGVRLLMVANGAATLPAIVCAILFVQQLSFVFAVALPNIRRFYRIEAIRNAYNNVRTAWDDKE